MRNTEEFNRRCYVRESLYGIKLQHTHSFIFIPSPIVARRKTLYGVSKQNTHTHIHIQRESPFPLFKIDIFHIRFYHAIAVTRYRYPLKNLSWVLYGISSSIGNLEDGGKSRGKGGRRTVDKLEIQRIEQFYVSMGGDRWLVASRMNYTSPRFDVERRRFCVDMK